MNKTVPVLMLASIFMLGGCQFVKGIFELGFGMGAVIVIAFVVFIAGMIALLNWKFNK